MKKLFTLSIAAVCSLGFAFSQPITNPYCDGTRYAEYIFTQVDTTSALVYGQNVTHCGSPQTMLLDVYEPNGDTATARPVLFVNYGGSFISGGRTDQSVMALCRNFAKRGFVAVAIDYRLFGFCGLPDSTRMLDVVVKAVGDQKAAIRYMRENAAQFRIDTNFVFLSGISAGAILANHTAYIDDTIEVPNYLALAINSNGGIEGNTSANYQYNSSVQGVWSMSGGLHKANWIDADDAPLIAIHETSDPTVPYATGFANINGINLITLEGGSKMHDRCEAISKPDVFFSIIGSGHTAYIAKPNIMDSLTNQAARFFEAILCGTTIPDYNASMPINFNPNGTGIESFSGSKLNFSVSPNPTSEAIAISVENKGKPYSVEVSDQLGRLVFSAKDISASNFKINQDKLGKGLFFVSIFTNDASSSTQRIVVQ